MRATAWSGGNCGLPPSLLTNVQMLLKKHLLLGESDARQNLRSTPAARTTDFDLLRKSFGCDIPVYARLRTAQDLANCLKVKKDVMLIFVRCHIQSPW
jgi:hypothetical protein